MKEREREGIKSDYVRASNAVVKSCKIINNNLYVVHAIKNT